MISKTGLAYLDDIEESFETSNVEGMDNPPDSVDVGDVGTADLEANVDAPEPAALTPPQAFRCENCGATFQDKGALAWSIYSIALVTKKWRKPRRLKRLNSTSSEASLVHLGLVC